LGEESKSKSKSKKNKEKKRRGRAVTLFFIAAFLDGLFDYFKVS